MEKIFISYRRDDCDKTVRQIYDRLVAHFGAKAVFLDVVGIPPGADFEEDIKRAIEQSCIFLALIGRKWLGKRVFRISRIQTRGDFVRTEVELALRRPLTLIPVLVDRRKMPAPRDVPNSIGNMLKRNAIHLRTRRDLSAKLDTLVDVVRTAIRARQAGVSPSDVEAHLINWMPQDSTNYEFESSSVVAHLHKGGLRLLSWDNWCRSIYGSLCGVFSGIMYWLLYGIRAVCCMLCVLCFFTFVALFIFGAFKFTDRAVIALFTACVFLFGGAIVNELIQNVWESHSSGESDSRILDEHQDYEMSYRPGD